MENDNEMIFDDGVLSMRSGEAPCLHLPAGARITVSVAPPPEGAWVKNMGDGYTAAVWKDEWGWTANAFLPNGGGGGRSAAWKWSAKILARRMVGEYQREGAGKGGAITFEI
jgi:hypothetical protein